MLMIILSMILQRAFIKSSCHYKNYQKEYVMRCAIWYHSRNLKNVKNTHVGVLILVKLQAEAS